MEAGNPFAKPDVLAAKRILAIQPHYDDNDIAAGGTLAALAERGAELFYLTVTDDLVGVIDQTLSEEAMQAQLRREQKEAGALIGVTAHDWLGYPDAGEYDPFDVRRDIIRHIRMFRPDFLFTCDPWLPYEAHRDHICTGKAVAEAALLYNLSRIETAPNVDDAFEPYDLVGVVFYATAHPNTIFDISGTRERKHQAVDCYRAQFSEGDMALLHMFLDYKEQEYAIDEPFSHGEPLKALRPFHLHGYPEAWKT
jgi:LmbE family N-acetylglucosaminyl deacetylase